MIIILTDLSFLNIGMPWPPEKERARLEKYAKNRQLFEGNHEEVYIEQFKRIERVIGNFNEVISYGVIVNFHKLVSLKTADLLLGEPPKITAGDDGSKEQKTIDKIIENCDLFNTAYQDVLDISRYGDGLFFIYKDKDSSSGKIDITQPSIWFPVISTDNLKKVLFHVLAWTYKQGSELLLKVHIHNKGSYEERIYSLNEQSKTIKALLGSKTIQTGLTDFAIIQVPNLITSDRSTGIDDYNDIDSIISEIEVRVSQIARILDKHAAPSVQGPLSALEQDAETGEWRLKMGNYFPRDTKDDPEVGYIVWDAQLDASFRILEKLINFLYTISEMGSALFGDTEGYKTGNALSGTALRRLMISPLAKVKRIKMRLDPALKKAIKLCSSLGGKDILNLSDVPISITWKDGLPSDPKEDADIMSIRTGNKPTISQFKAIQQLDGLGDVDTQTELDRIIEDEARTNPLNGINSPFAGDNKIVDGAMQ